MSIGQNDFGSNGIYTNYEAIHKCIKELSTISQKEHKSVGFPYYMSCDRGGGDWSIIYNYILQYFGNSKEDCFIVQWKESK